MIVIGDVHGQWNALEGLLSKLPPDRLVFVGDVIDRGPDSCSVVEFVRQHDCVLGNHEQMLLAALGRVPSPRWANWRHWLHNGGNATLTSYEQQYQQNPELPADVIDWMASLPLYREYPLEDGRTLFVSHAAWLHDYIDKGGIAASMWDENSGILWNRECPPEMPGYFFVYGHTASREIELMPHYACIDTGAAYRHRLTALQVPSMKVFCQDCTPES